MKRSVRNAFKWMLGVAILALTGGLPVGGWGAPVSAGGGDDVYDIEEGGISYRVHVFTNTGPATLTITNGGFVDCLVVGGGGGGGGGGPMSGGGGGGGVIMKRYMSVTSGVYTVTVGAGGLGGNAYNMSGQNGVRGTDSSVGGELVAFGGGGGCGWTGHPSTSGGSGGGGSATEAASSGTVGQGHDGAIGSNTKPRSGGGGGGAGEPGGLGVTSAGGKGGDGREVFGSTYGGGGGGGLEALAGTSLEADGGGAGGLGGGGAGSRGSTKAMDAEPNTGGGGGGAGYTGTSTGRLGGNGGTGIVMIRYASGPMTPAPDVTLADTVTGSERFTNTNAVRISVFPTYDGYDRVQCTGESNSISSIDAEGWVSISSISEYYATFDRPATDTNITLYVWFSNTVDTARALLRSTGQIYYTSEVPVVAVRTVLTRAQLPGTNAVITIEDLDIGSSGGVANGVNMSLYARKVVAINSEDDLSSEETYVTLPAVLGNYPLQLWLQNEAGNAITSVATCLVSVVEYSGTNTWTGMGVSDLWSEAANWSAGLPADGQDIRINSGSLRLTAATADLASFTLAQGVTLSVEGWESALTATDMTVAGTITHAANMTTEPVDGEWIPEHRIWLQGSNITVTATGTLNADSRGYQRGYGPGGGKGWDARPKGGGGGYGGAGSVGEEGAGGPAYGDPALASQPGSGGNIATVSGHGGGAIRLRAGGNVRIDGTLTVRGGNGGGHGAGGSGGGISLVCETLQGNGQIRADGGNHNQSGGAGGGGRIAIHYNPVAQAALPIPGVKFSAYSELLSYTYDSEMGTLYLPDAFFLTETLSGKRFWHTRLVIPGWTSWHPANLILNDCVIALPAGFDLTVSGNLVLTNNARLFVKAAFTNAPSERFGMTVQVGDNLIVAPGCWIHPHADQTNGAIVRIRVAGDITIATTGGIMADAKGYLPQVGDLNGLGAGLGKTAGGGYGGAGGKTGGGAPYGEPAAFPRHPGSPGGFNTHRAGSGGGAIHLTAGGTLHVDGTLTANGRLGIYGAGPGGSGGSILVFARRVTGSGALSAHGGDSNSGSGTGGGGRIALWSGLPTELVETRLEALTVRGVEEVDREEVFSGAVDVSEGQAGYLGAVLGEPGTAKFYHAALGVVIIVR